MLPTAGVCQSTVYTSDLTGRCWHGSGQHAHRRMAREVRRGSLTNRGKGKMW